MGICDVCDGDGFIDGNQCRWCGGSGEEQIQHLPHDQYINLRILELAARRNATKGFVMNNDMIVETQNLQATIDALHALKGKTCAELEELAEAAVEMPPPVGWGDES